MIMYLSIVKPFALKSKQILEIFNELCLLTVSYNLFIFTDFVSNAEIKYIVGYFVMSITMLNILVNIVLIIKSTITKVLQLVMKLVKKYKDRRVKKYQMKYPINSSPDLTYQSRIEAKTQLAQTKPF